MLRLAKNSKKKPTNKVDDEFNRTISNTVHLANSPLIGLALYIEKLTFFVLGSYENSHRPATCGLIEI
jgi:hypothetical protein